MTIPHLVQEPSTTRHYLVPLPWGATFGCTLVTDAQLQAVSSLMQPSPNSMTGSRQVVKALLGCQRLRKKISAQRVAMQVVCLKEQTQKVWNIRQSI